jgi:hypothetical protein
MIRIVVLVGILGISGGAASPSYADSSAPPPPPPGSRITLTNAKHTPHSVPHCKHGKPCHATPHGHRR